jgi:hypothetical protein
MKHIVEKIGPTCLYFFSAFFLERKITQLLTPKEKHAHLLPNALPKLGKKKKRKEEEKRKHTNNPTSVA